MPLEEAIQHFTPYLPAKFVGLKDRGLLAEGMYGRYRHHGL